MSLLKQSTARVRVIQMIDSTDNVSGKTGLSLTVTLSKNGAAFGALGGSVAEISSGFYAVSLNTADTNTLGDLQILATGTGAYMHPVDPEQVVVDLPGASVSSVTGSVASVTAGVTLAASAVQAIWDALTSALTTSGSVGERITKLLTTSKFLGLK